MSDGSLGTGPRLDYVDVAKAFGIVLVVVGHAVAEPVEMLMLVYSFHMPLFFFLSGCLQRPAHFDVPLGFTAQRAARALLVPYAFFFLVSMAYWLVTRNIGQRALQFAGVGADDALRGLFTGLSADLFVNVTLWFFPCMFACQVGYAALRRRVGAGAALLWLVAAAVLLMVATTPWEQRLPWGLDIVWIALVFYAAGHWLQVAGHMARLAAVPLKVLFVPLGATALLWLALANVQGPVDLARARFGLHPSLFVPCALAGVGFVVAIAQRVPLSRGMRWLADNSIVIFPLHPLLINFASGLLQLSGRKALADQSGLVWYAAATAWGLLASVPAAFMLRRHFPALIGLRGKSQLLGAT